MCVVGVVVLMWNPRFALIVLRKLHNKHGLMRRFVGLLDIVSNMSHTSKSSLSPRAVDNAHFAASEDVASTRLLRFGVEFPPVAIS